MPRLATGQVMPPEGKQRSWAIRFRAYGKRRFVTLGRPEDGWSRPRAEAELRHVLADVERGVWQPHKPAVVEAPSEVPTFHEFASEWLEARQPELSEGTLADYTWTLTGHLLPFFADHLLSEITVREIDRYKAATLRESERRRKAIEEGKPLYAVRETKRGEVQIVLRPLSGNSINKTLTRLSQILRTARKYDLIAANPVEMADRVNGTRPNRPHVEPEQLLALLDAAEQLDNGYSRVARPILATLAGAGLRIGEALALRWADVNEGTGTIRVGEAKTPAGVREVELTPALLRELLELSARTRDAESHDPVFASAAGTELDRHRIRERVLKPAVRLANVSLERDGIEPIEKATLHGLRRTYASLRAALRDDPVYIADQLGHEDATFSMKVYAKSVKRRQRLSGVTLAAFDRALQWAEMGRNDERASSALSSPFKATGPQTASTSGK